MDQPLVSVIIPAYNASAFIAETLESILAQTYQNLEIIVVDDGSTDTTAEIVKSYAPHVKYLYQENSGSCAAPRNHGLNEAKGEFVTFFDADDIMLPHKIASQVEALIAEPTALISITNYCNFFGANRSNDHFSTCPHLLFFLKASPNDSDNFLIPSLQCRNILVTENFTIASAPLFRREILRDLGGFDESLKACEDFHLIYRSAIKGNVSVSPTIGFDRRLHDVNMSNDHERMLKSLTSSRLSLMRYEPDRRLKKKLKTRAQNYNRKLQSNLITKGQLFDAVQIYKKTFPPTTISSLLFDVRQAAKIILRSINRGINSQNQNN